MAEARRRTWLVTGASAGIGRATALYLLQQGEIVYGAARRVDRMEPLRAVGGHVLELDVTDDSALEQAVQTIVREQGRLDVLVNNAGTGVHGSVEEVPMENARQVFDVNVFGPARLVQLVLPQMRKQGSGTIVNVSSIGGEITLPLAAWYYASKHALEAFSDTLRQEVRRFGIDVVVIQPGLIKTGFEADTPRELREWSGRGAYASMANAMADAAEKSLGPESKSSDPIVVAQAILKAVDAQRPKPRYAVGYLGKFLLRMHRVLPDRAWDWIATRRDASDEQPAGARRSAGPSPS